MSSVLGSRVKGAGGMAEGLVAAAPAPEGSAAAWRVSGFRVQDLRLRPRVSS